jgi:hypothetical protein
MPLPWNNRGIKATGKEKKERKKSDFVCVK